MSIQSNRPQESGAPRDEEATKRGKKPYSTPVITVLQVPFFPPGPDDRRLVLSAALGIVLGGMAGIVLAFLVDGHESGLDQYRTVGAHAVAVLFRAYRHFDRNSVEYCRYHLARHRALPDQ